MDYQTLPVDEWDENHVKCWLESIRVKEECRDKLYKEQVTGPVLQVLDKASLKEMGIKEGQMQLLLCKRTELLQLRDNAQQATSSSSKARARGKAQTAPGTPSNGPAQSTAGGGSSGATGTTSTDGTAPASGDSSGATGTTSTDGTAPASGDSSGATGTTSTDSTAPASGDSSGATGTTSTDGTAPASADRQSSSDNTQPQGPEEVLEVRACRPFRSQDVDFKYVKDTILVPESGVSDLITPCHEYKSLDTASTLDKKRLQSKFASEVIRFASACMNIRTNGTIHFGVMDSVENKGWKHGHVVGIKVKNREDYVEALDLYIEKCFCENLRETARKCIHPPVFIEVISKAPQEQRFVVEVDIEPTHALVKKSCFEVYLPSYNESSCKVIPTKEPELYQRVGAKSEPVQRRKLTAFIQAMPDRDAQREKAELSSTQVHLEIPQDLGRKLSILLNDGKSYMDDSLRYILVTNRCEQHHLNHINFLMHLKIFCVFDFDEHSNVSGLCSKYKEHHEANSYFLEDFFKAIKTDAPPSQKLFDQTSWIFCNGRSDFLGDEKPCDENTWIRTKKKHLKKVITCICEEILPQRSFIVLFLFLSPVEKPLVDTFQEFYTEMNGMDYIICIAESRENYGRWANLAQASCSIETLEQHSVVGMKLSHIDATVQAMLPSTAQPRHLPVSTGGVCILPSREEEKLSSLEILCVDQCDDIKLDLWTKEQIQETEQNFYRGRKIIWENLWLADKRLCGDIIEREACKDASKLLDGILRGTALNHPVAKLKIFHHPGSGGSTIARQVLWKSRKNFRCAVIKTSYSPSTVCNHVLALKDYEEREITHCFPVLLLIEDYDDEYFEELQSGLLEAAATRKMNTPRPHFILICCKRCNDPESLCKASPLDTVAVTHKLTESEKSLFNTKLEKLKQNDVKPEFILTFVLMCEEFSATYVSDVVANILQGIDPHSRDTCLMRYVALLNCYVPNSSVSLSHCEAFLGLGAYIESKSRACDFKHRLSEQARMIFIELSESIPSISSIRIVHCLVAKEILHQLSVNESQSQLAINLLHEKTLLENRLGQEKFIKFIKHLFIRREKRSRGDNTDTLFSPFIEHVWQAEDCERAIAVLEAGYELLGKDPLFAQQLARLNYSNKKFEDAKQWAETAKAQLPNDSYILDTEGQVYRKWFSFSVDEMTEDTPQTIIQKIEIALKAMKCFRAAQDAAKAERDIMNNSGFHGEVEVGCRLLRFLSTVPVFQKSPEGEYTELVKYLTTDYIPEGIKKTWGNLHSRLKGLRQNLYNALEWISEELSYFQTDKNQDKDYESDRKEEQSYNPRRWLKRQSEVYAKYFVSESLMEESNNGPESELIRRMTIYKNGGGNVTNILWFLTDKKESRSAEKLEKILSFYPANPLTNRLEDNDLINYIFCHITLACLAPGSDKLLPLQTLRELSTRFFKIQHTKHKVQRPFPASAYFLLTLLYWPDEALDKEHNPDKDDILTSALQTLKRLYDIKMKDVSTKEKRIYTHFFLGKGYGLSKIVQKAKIDKLIPGLLDERRMKWLNGNVWNIPSISDNLKRVSGWTEDRHLFIKGHKKKLPVLALHHQSVPHGNENVTFYLGFSFNGLVAFNIERENDAGCSRTSGV